MIIVHPSSETVATAPSPGLRQKLAKGLGALVLAGGILAAVIAAQPPAKGANAPSKLQMKATPPQISPPKTLELAHLSTSDPRELETVSPHDALTINALRPISLATNPAAAALSVPMTDMASYAHSVDCLAAAIYYEAASEPIAGQRAVAQVVLNRLRHPLFAATVCGVVFQGAEQHTGCQFSFACDGSLARIPDKRSWSQARDVAIAAVNGYVYAPVGLATHYHADYVVPLWAPTLLKVAVIGHHIFYRIDGAYGRPAAFQKAYAGPEPQPAFWLARTFQVIEPTMNMLVAQKSVLSAPSARSVLDNAAPATVLAPMRQTQPKERWVIGAPSDATGTGS